MEEKIGGGVSLEIIQVVQMVEGAVAAAVAASEAEDRCVPEGAVAGVEVSSGGLCCHCRIGLVWRSGFDAVICFHMPA